MKIDLCCGLRKPEGFYGIDIIPFQGVDIVHDLNEGIPIETSRCIELRAYDAIEHIKDARKLMKEIWRVCDDGATVDIKVPSTDGRGAFQDATHLSWWNENSFGYWCTDEAWADYYRGSALFKVVELSTSPMSWDRVCHTTFKATVVKTVEWLNICKNRGLL